VSKTNTLKQDFRFGQISQEDYDEARTDRLAVWRKLSALEQLADLDRRCGVGVGSKRQRTKLNAIIHKPLPKPKPKLTPAPETEFAVNVALAETPKKKKFKKGNKS
jgi:hypothetical protein